MHRFKKTLKITGVVLATILFLAALVLSIFYYKVMKYAYAESTEVKESVIQYLEEDYLRDTTHVDFFDAYDFNPVAFENPDFRFGPFARWWWPGNDVNDTQIQKEIKMMAKTGIAGIEIQPFSTGLNPDAPDDEFNRVNSYDTPSFYNHLRTAMQAAREVNMAVDINAGSGWPLAGPQNSINDNFKNVFYSERTVKGNKKIQWEIDLPRAPLSSFVTYFTKDFTNGFIDGSRTYFDYSEIEEVIAAKLIKNERSRWAYRITDQVVLDPSDVRILTDKVKNGVLEWDVPDGKWHIIAVWSTPNGEIPSLNAGKGKDRGFVVDHFDTLKVRANYNYLFGKRTGLVEFYNNPFRAVFNDSYELKTERFFPGGIFEEFKKRRGYDIRPFIPAIFKPGYNHQLAEFGYPHAKPDFVLTEEDDRIRYDYDLTVGELFIERFFGTSNKWAEERGLAHRTQGYGMPFDYIKAAGNVTIPEAESGAGEGSIVFTKYITSGAHLYNRPIIASETLAGFSKGFMTTPQKIKLFLDKGYTSGINQIIYHGIPYEYHTEDFGEFGWHPFDSPFFFPSFSTALNENNIFWEDLPDINTYAKRCQYVLQSGNPKSDVLIYTYLDRLEGFGGLSDKNELLIRGSFDEQEPMQAKRPSIPFSDIDLESSHAGNWLDNLYPVINALDERGVSWEWVNDAIVQEEAKIEDEGILNINGHRYKSILIPHPEYMQVGTAQKFKDMAEAGVEIIFIGELPKKQPSFKNYQIQDKLLNALVSQTFQQTNSRKVDNVNDLIGWMDDMDRTLAFTKKQPLLFHIQREQSDGSRVVFIRSRSSSTLQFETKPNNNFEFFYGLNPVDAKICQLGPGQKIELGPYGTIFLYFTNNEVSKDLLSPNNWSPIEKQKVLSLDTWDIQAENVDIRDTQLFDWITNEHMQYLQTATYTTSFEIGSIDSNKKYVLDLGKVGHVAKITLNGSNMGKLIYAPYTIDITNALESGQNIMTIEVKTAQINSFAGKGKNGNKRYEKYKDRPLLSSGLFGPVHILRQTKTNMATH